MRIYYLFIEGKPYANNPESKEVIGAYINCWVKAKDKATAKDKAVEYLDSEGWEMINIEEISYAKRSWYVDKPESLECYDQTVKYGISAIFYTYRTND